MNPTKRERIAMLTKENAELKASIVTLTAEVITLHNSHAELLTLLAATPVPVQPITIERHLDPTLVLKCQTLEQQIAYKDTQLTQLIKKHASTKWQSIKTLPPENKPVLTKYPIASELGYIRISVRKGMWWHDDIGREGKRLNAPLMWRELPE